MRREMHGSVIEFIRTIPPERTKGKYVLEIGSRSINGTPRSVIMDMNPRIYMGIDMMEGEGVDLVLNAEKLLTRFKKNCADIVISTEMLEHVENWPKIVWQMKAVTNIGGLLVITARSPGFPRHKHPNDYWRFTKEDFELIFSDMEILTLEDDPQTPGVFMIAEKYEEINAENYPELTVQKAP
jgi:SAM-dependent methyltransferase